MAGRRPDDPPVDVPLGGAGRRGRAHAIGYLQRLLKALGTGDAS
jgi:hypothetical protein